MTDADVRYKRRRCGRAPELVCALFFFGFDARVRVARCFATCYSLTVIFPLDISQAVHFRRLQAWRFIRGSLILRIPELKVSAERYASQLRGRCAVLFPLPSMYV